MNKTVMLDKLADFVSQRPGLEYVNYGEAKAYRSELRKITRYYAPCLFLISKAHADEALTAEDIAETARRTFSDRLKWNEARQAWDYTAGQYWPTEYRAAAWALLAKLLPVYASHRKYKNL